MKEVDVLFDRSPKVVYPSRVVSERRTIRYPSLPNLTIEPWGPVKADDFVPSPTPGHRFEAGEPICVVLREGALGVPWYTAEQCAGG